MFNRSKITAACGALLTAGAVGGVLASPAHASTEGDQDGYAYTRELHNVGITPAHSGAILAQSICEKRAEGYTQDAVIEYEESPPPPIASHRQAVVIVTGAEWHFCPSYYIGGENGAGESA
jgi:hypothetical protein